MTLYVNYKRILLHFMSQKSLIRHIFICFCTFYSTLSVLICVHI